MARASRSKEPPDYLKYVPFSDQDYNLFLLMHLALNAVSKARHYQVTGMGITHTEFLLLYTVSALGGSATPAEISRWMMRKPPTTSGLLNRMERNGLIKRRGHTKNRKLRKVVITRKGKEAYERAAQNDVMHTIMACLSEAEFKRLWALLEKLKDTSESLAQEIRVAG